MKKIIFLSLIAVLFLVVGCDLFCPEPPVVVTKQYTIEVSVVGIGGTISPSGIFKVDSGKDQTFALTSEPGYKPDSVIVNGVSSPFFAFTNKYVLSNINSDSKVKFIFKKTLSWYLMLKPWTKDAYEIRQEDGTWNHFKSSYPSNVNIVTYLPNGRLTIYRDGVLVGDGPWSIDETTNPATLNTGGLAVSYDGAIRVFCSHH
jgi:hypothetical protein